MFAFVYSFLQHHHDQIIDNTFYGALKACFNIVTGADIANYMAEAHIPVPGLPYKPYSFAWPPIQTVFRTVGIKYTQSNYSQNYCMH